MTVKFISYFLLCLFILNIHHWTNAHNKINILPLSDTLSPKIKGVLDDAIYVRSALELDSIKIYDTNFYKLKIDSFQLKLFSVHKPADIFMFKGNVAPNIFKNYQLYKLDKNNTEHSDYDGFRIIVYYSDSKKRVYESQPKMIYFSVMRGCINGSIKNK